MSRVRQHDLSEEEEALIKRSTIITSNIKTVKAPLTLEQQLEKDTEAKRQHKKEKAYAEQWEAVQEINRNIEEDHVFRLTQGREHLLDPNKPEMMLWEENATCEFCGKSDLKKLMDGWCGWNLGKARPVGVCCMMVPRTLMETFTVRPTNANQH
jgi:hypothetical protein